MPFIDEHLLRQFNAEIRETGLAQFIDTMSERLNAENPLLAGLIAEMARISHDTPRTLVAAMAVYRLVTDAIKQSKSTSFRRN